MGQRRDRQPGARVVQFERLEHRNLTERVYSTLKARIISQDIELGARLRDEELAAQLGVSRTPVREALMRLNREGLVDVVPRSETRVRVFSESDVEQIYDVRIALESLAVRRAVKTLKPDHLRHLKKMHERGEAAFQRRDFHPVLEFDRELHRLILEASGNRKLQDIMETINDFVSLFRNLGARLPAHHGFNYRHREIMHALARRDADAAATALAEHIEGAKVQLLRDLQERQILQSLSAPPVATDVTTLAAAPPAPRPKRSAGAAAPASHGSFGSPVAVRTGLAAVRKKSRGRAPSRG